MRLISLASSLKASTSSLVKGRLPGVRSRPRPCPAASPAIASRSLAPSQPRDPPSSPPARAVPRQRLRYLLHHVAAVRQLVPAGPAPPALDPRQRPVRSQQQLPPPSDRRVRRPVPRQAAELVLERPQDLL